MAWNGRAHSIETSPECVLAGAVLEFCGGVGVPLQRASVINVELGCIRGMPTTYKGERPRNLMISKNFYAPCENF